MTEWNKKGQDTKQTRETKEGSLVEEALRLRIKETKAERRDFRKWAAGTALLLALVFLLTRVWFGLAVVEGSSMNPGYQDQDLILYTKIEKGLKRGDVVLAEAPDGRILIKRVIGLPREELSIEGEKGNVSINGEQLEEPYVKGQTIPGLYQENPLTLEEGEYFLMGDNRENSKDSRYYGPIEEERIQGKVLWSLRKD